MGTPLPLHIETAGRGAGHGVDTYLLIHGYAASTFSWRHWTPRLADRGHVVAIDMKGFGRAPKPDDSRYGPDDQAQLVHRLVVERDLRDLTLVGHSLGGGVALLTALRLLDEDPGRLKRLVIVAGAAYKQRLPPFVRLSRFPGPSAFLFRLIGADRCIRHVLRSIVHDPGIVTEAQVLGYAETNRSKPAVRALLVSARQIMPPRFDELAARYREIDVPTLLIWGRGDRVVPLSVGERLAQALPNAHLHVFEACGHLPAEELPEESYAVLDAFLDQRIST